MIYNKNTLFLFSIFSSLMLGMMKGSEKGIYVKKIAYNKRKIIGLCTCVYFLKKDFFDEKKRVLFAKLNPSTAAGIDAVFNATVAVPGIYALLDFYLSACLNQKNPKRFESY